MSDLVRVLIVEDCKDTAESTAMILQAWGMTTSIARDGRSALARAGQSLPDVVLLDIGLSDMNGLDVARTLREAHRFDRTMIVVLSGYAALRDRKRSLESGCQHHIVKPVDLEDLRLILSTGLKEFRGNEAANACAPGDRSGHGG